MAEKHQAVRLDKATLARMPSVAKSLSTKWHTATQSDVLRFLVILGLDTFEGIDDTKREFKKAAKQRETVAKTAEGSQEDGS